MMDIKYTLNQLKSLLMPFCYFVLSKRVLFVFLGLSFMLTGYGQFEGEDSGYIIGDEQPCKNSGSYTYSVKDISTGHGFMYNQKTAHDPNFPPAGWRIPSTGDFRDLINDCGGESLAFNVLRTNNNYPNGEGSWSDGGGTNNFNFSATGSGDYLGNFVSLGSYSDYWSTSHNSYAFMYIDGRQYRNKYKALIYAENPGGYPGSDVKNIRFVKDYLGAPNSGLTDIDGNVYPTVIIDDKVWMAVNYRCKHLNNGTAIPLMNNWWTDINMQRNNLARLPYNGDPRTVSEDEEYESLWTYTTEEGATIPGVIINNQGSSVSITFQKDSYNGRLRYWVNHEGQLHNLYYMDLEIVENDPIIYAHPSSASLCLGEMTTLQVTASGTDLQYTWQSSSNGIDWGNVKLGGVGPQYDVVVNEDEANRSYRCAVTGHCGTVYSNTATITLTSPIIGSHPVGNVVCSGNSAVYNISATGVGLSYQWQYSSNGTIFYDVTTGTGATTASYTETSTTGKNGYLYRCELSNSCETIYSNSAILSVNSALVIDNQPTDATVCNGENAVFNIVAGGCNSTKQWQLCNDDNMVGPMGSGVASSSSSTFACSWEDIPGETGNSLTLYSLGMNDGETYRCKLTGAGTIIYSNSVDVIMREKTYISYNPSDKEACLGDIITFDASAQGYDLTFRWWRETRHTPWELVKTEENVTSSDFIQTSPENYDGATYQCIVTGYCGNANSNIVTLDVIQWPPVPDIITGNQSQCPGQTNQTYSIVAVERATEYNWTVPAGWSIDDGQNSTSIEVTAGSSGDNGDISVTAGNCSGTSTASTLAVSVTPVPSTPGAISGLSIQCVGATNQTYSVAAVEGATTYNWTVPSGWEITEGLNTNSIKVTSGVAGQNGNITVTAQSSCSTSAASSKPVSINSDLLVLGAINGFPNPCEFQANQVYSVDPVEGASSYNWIIPGDWTITGGLNTNSITVTTGQEDSQGGHISVTAIGCSGTSLSSEMFYNVNAIPTKPGTISGSSTLCAGQANISYSVSEVNDATSYNWTVPSGWTITEGQGSSSITVSAGELAQSGNVSVRSVNCGESSAATTKTVTVKPILEAPGVITGSSTHCAEATMQSYSIEPVSGATSYNWTIPSGWEIISKGIYSNQIIVKLGSTAISGNISVTADSDCGTSAVSTKTVTVTTIPAIPGAISGTSTQCAGLTNQTYSIASVSGADSYTWEVPDGWSITSDNGSSIVVTAGSSGENGNISVTAESDCGTSAASTKTVTVTPIPATPGAISGTSTQCPGQANQTYSITAVVDATNYIWEVPDGWSITSDNGSSIVVTAGSSGENGNISVTAESDFCTSAASTKAVTVTPIPATPGAITGNELPCEDQINQIYSIAAVSSATNYIWEVPDGWDITSGEGTNSIEVTVGSSGDNGNVSVTASNCSGTSAASTKAVTIASIPATPSAISGISTQCFDQTNQNYSIIAVEGVADYLWTVPVGWEITSGEGTNSIEVTVGSPGDNGNISVTANNCSGTSAASTKAVTVNYEVSFTGLAADYDISGDAYVLTGTPAHNNGAPNNFGKFICNEDELTYLKNSDEWIFVPLLDPGTYDITYEYNDGTCSNSETQSVEVHEPIIVTIGGDIALCSDNLETSLDVTYNGEGTWSFDCLYTGSDNTQTISKINIDGSVYTIPNCAEGHYEIIAASDVNGDAITIPPNTDVYVIQSISPDATFGGSGLTCNDNGELPIYIDFNNSVAPWTFTYQIVVGEAPPEIFSVTSSESRYVFTNPVAGTYTLSEVYNPYCTTILSETKLVQKVGETLSMPDLNENYCNGEQSEDIKGLPDGGHFNEAYGFTTDGSDVCTFNPPNPGTYKLTYTYTSSGCTQHYTQTVVVHEKPTAEIISDAHICGTEETFLEVALSGATEYTVNYQKDGGTPISVMVSDTDDAPLDLSTNYELPITEPGDYQLFSVVSNDCARTLQGGERTVGQSDIPKARIKNTAPSSGICAEVSGLEIKIGFSKEGSYTYSVESESGIIGPLTVDDKKEDFYPVNKTGIYSIVDFSDAYCQGTTEGSFNLKVHELPTATLSGNGSICGYEAADIAIAFTGSYPYSYEYSITTTGTDDQESTIEILGEHDEIGDVIISVELAENEQKKLFKLLSVTDENCTGTVDSEEITVERKPLPEVTISGGGSVYADEEATIIFDLIGEPDWIIGYTIDGVEQTPITANITPFDYQSAIPGLYEVTGIEDNNCVGEEFNGSALINIIGEPLPCKECISSFAPIPGEKYILSAWVKQSALSLNGSYSDIGIDIVYEGANLSTGMIIASGAIIDDWQRIEHEFVIPNGTTAINVNLVNGTVDPVYFDDIRIQPFASTMKSYVYDPITLKLAAELDENNYATYYEYDEEGALIRIKKETERGVKTIQESFNNKAKAN